VDTEEPPPLFGDLNWVWQAFCFLSERRGVGPNGPLPLNASDIQAYSELTGRVDEFHRHQLLRFLPPLDRVYLKDFYDTQSKETEKARRKSEAGNRPRKR
jgi:hypothetical protein